MKIPSSPYKKATEYVESLDYEDSSSAPKVKSALKWSLIALAAVLVTIGLTVGVYASGVFSQKGKSAEEQIQELTERSERGVNDPPPNVSMPANASTTSWTVYPISGHDLPSYLSKVPNTLDLAPYDPKSCESVSEDLTALIHKAMPYYDNNFWVQAVLSPEANEIKTCPQSIPEEESTFFVSDGDHKSSVLYVVTAQGTHLLGSNLLDLSNNQVDIVWDAIVRQIDDPIENPLFDNWGDAIIHTDYAAIPNSSTLIEALSQSRMTIFIQGTSSNEVATKAIKDAWAKRTQLPVSDLDLRVVMVPSLDPINDNWFEPFRSTMTKS